MSEAKQTTSRRDLLKLAGVGLPAAAVTVVAGEQAAAVEAPETAGYRETAHVRKYLETARF
ncbi:MAG: hypothetical protein AAF074_20555 [Pseudomonadota bacterium]